MRRVAITGYGSICALGTGVAQFADALRAGRCGIGVLTLFDAAQFRTGCAAEVQQLRAPEWLSPPMARRASRSTLLALIAAREALQCSHRLGVDGASAGVIVGTTTGGLVTGEECYRVAVANTKRTRALSGWLETPLAVPADLLAHAFGCQGPRLTVSTACSSGANALGLAADWIRAGKVDVALCGGTDSLCRMTYSGFNALQALDRVPCRPFDRQRAGLTLGEGAAFFVFEAWEHATARGVDILGEFVSYGTSADAHHLTQPRPDGASAELAMRRALREGSVSVEEVDYVNAHGTGTPLNDVVETRVIKAVLGPRAQRIPISSTKSMIGHCLGAAGALEALASLLAIRGRFVPPTATLTEPDPECDLDYVPHTSRAMPLATVVSNSYGFGGSNTSLVIRRCES